MTRLSILACSLLVCSAPATAGAQDADAEEQIRTAIRRGVQFLKTRQANDGSWHYGGHDLGMTALAGLALAENGVTLEDPTLKRAYEYVQANAATHTQTYDISLAILILVKVGDASDNDLVRLLGAKLAAGQLTSGGWAYNCPQSVPAPPPAGAVTNKRTGGGSVTNKPTATTDAKSGKSEPPKRAGRIAGGRAMGPGFGDNSNTQFAVLGVWAAGQAGLDVSETMAAVDQRFRTTQAKSGGWGYNGPGGDQPAMTCAGLMALILAKGQKTIEAQMVNRPPGDAVEGPGGKPKMASDPQIDRGIDRVEFYAGHLAQNANLYFLWSVERVGVALGTARIGRVDWYSTGASLLLRTQAADGSWRSAHGELPDTSFALLFLRRSNLTKGMPQLLTNRSGETSDTKLRAGALEDLLKTVRTPAGAAPPESKPKADKPK